MPPHVVERRVHRIGPVSRHLESERQPPLEREVAKHALAEPVDGHDVGAIEVQQRQVQASRDVGAVDAAALPAFEQVNRLAIRTGGLAPCPAQCGPQRRTYAVAQLPGRRDGERDHQQLPDLDAFLDQQTGDKGGQRIRLSRSRAGFDQELRRIA